MKIGQASMSRREHFVAGAHAIVGLQAYETLSDDEKRRYYDQTGFDNPQQYLHALPVDVVLTSCVLSTQPESQRCSLK